MRQRTDRRVRRLVARYGACLPELPARQRRVLRLRAGIGPRPPASRIAVARRLDITVARVRRAERRGLRSLLRASRNGCAASVPGDGETADPVAAGAVAVLASGTDSTGGGAAAAGGDGDAPPSQRGGGDDGGDGGSRSGDSGRSDGRGSGGVLGLTATKPPAGGPTDLTMPLLLLVLAALGGGAAWAAWRRRAARAADAGPEQP